MEATVQETDGTAVLGALERAMSPSALKKTGTLGKLFETKTPSVTVLTNGRSRSPTVILAFFMLRGIGRTHAIAFLEEAFQTTHDRLATPRGFSVQEQS